jgi:aldehyde dehydrogenase (NAD+)/betaine-aldehyde dehydrogenase
MLAINKVGAALAAGCTVVLVPSPRAPLSTLLLAAICRDEVPPGVLNVVVGDQTIARGLTEHAAVDKVSFTGSVEIGTQVGLQAAAGVRDVVLELGGKAPALLLPDCDLDAVVRPLLLRLFRNAGQGCQVPSRILVHRAVVERFVELSRAVIRELVIGDPLDPATDIGPVITAAQRDRVLAVVNSAVADGGEILASAAAPDLPGGNWVGPMLIGGVDNRSPIGREEIFGPIGVMLVYDDLEEAIAMANDTDYGLAAYVYGRDVDDCVRVARAVRAGSVFVNGVGMRPDGPSGGFKRSGIGREQGEEGIMEFLAAQHIRWPIDTSSDRRAM